MDSETVKSYFKSNYSNYTKHLQNIDGLKINLPSAESTRAVIMSNPRLIIRAGIIAKEVKIWVGNEASNIDNLKDHIQAQINYQTINPITANVLIDKEITMDIVFEIFESLRANDILSIQLITENKGQDNFINLRGLYIRIPFKKTRIKETKAR